jgi:transposase InsO family protein
LIRKINTNLKLLCSIAGVSKSGYYKWLEHADEEESDYEDYILIKEIFTKGKGKYGWRTIQMKLESEKGVIMNHKKIQRIKIKYQLFTKIRKINPYKAIMKKTMEHRVFENVLNREFKQSTPYKVFGTDITYIPFNHRMAYLSIIKDFASGEIIAWNMSQHLDMSIVMDTIEDMLRNPSVPMLSDALIHSDQGFHYTSPQYIHTIQKLDMVQSMSRKGCCIDNAPTESFFGHFKDDVDYKSCKTFEELKEMVGSYISYYNNDRQQWDLKKMTPVSYRNHLLLTQ